jgi:putative ABC transport system permease protein
MEFSYDQLLDLSFKLVLPTDFYVQNSDGTWTDMRDDEEFMSELLDGAMDIYVSGIIRASESAYATSITAGMIGYTSELDDYIVEANSQADILQAQLSDEDTDVFTGLPFSDGEEVEISAEELQSMLASMGLSDEQLAMLGQMSEEEITAMLESYGMIGTSSATLEDNLDALGYGELKSPTAINLYCEDFASKDDVTALIDKYNELNPNKEITYTDYIGLMMSSVTSIINAITYVLIAFVAISLIVSSIMIGIITYISVLERTKEIGILRSIGASKRDISRVFNAETFIIGLISGLLGILVTILLNIPISKVIEHVIHVKGVSSLPLAGGVTLVIISVVLTLIGGFIPSRLAAKKDPVIALRTE